MSVERRCSPFLALAGVKPLHPGEPFYLATIPPIPLYQILGKKSNLDSKISIFKDNAAWYCFW